MGWFKRNLFFAIGGIVALGLLAAAGIYDYKSWQRNTAAVGQLTELYKQLQKNTVTDKNGHKISPGNDKTDNIAAAKEQERQLRQWLSQTTNYFRPIAPVPKPANGQMTDALFNGALHRAIIQLNDEAAAANVALPPDFYFSFTADKERPFFAPGSLGPLSVQLGEVKTIAEVLFGAGVNALDGIQRVSVSSDDTGGPQTDYLNDQPVTNNLAVLVPYQVTFRGFTPEIARVLGAFAASPHGFMVTTISVQPAPSTGMNPAEAGAYSPAASSQAAALAAYYRAAGGAPPAAATAPGRGGLQVVLNEQLLSITLKVEVVKLTRN